MWEGTSCERQARGKARARDGVVERRAGKASEEGFDLTCVVAGKLRSYPSSSVSSQLYITFKTQPLPSRLWLRYYTANIS